MNGMEKITARMKEDAAHSLSELNAQTEQELRRIREESAACAEKERETAGGRVSTWIDLWTSSQTEKPIDRLTDTERSMIAIHNGGLLGEGAGQSAMRVEMIHPESDYAYAFFVEEYGIILAGILLMLYLWIFFRAREIFVRCGTAFPGLLVLGLALMITCQALLHVMVTVNLMPETGQTLPLISRGGSSVLFTVIALGMILSVSRQNDEHSHDTPRSESIYEK